MYFDIDALDARRSYKLLTSTIVPRPIAWVVTVDPQGIVNAAPFSFFNAFSGAPPIVCLGIGQRVGRAKDTLANIRSGGQFVINMVSADMVEAMNITAVDFPADHDELQLAGLASTASTKVGPPRITDSPVAFECAFQQAVDIEHTGHIVIGRVLAMHVRDDAVTDAAKCTIDTVKLDLVGRMESPGWYTRTRDRFELAQMGFGEWQARQAAASSSD